MNRFIGKTEFHLQVGARANFDFQPRVEFAKLFSQEWNLACCHTEKHMERYLPLAQVATTNFSPKKLMDLQIRCTTNVQQNTAGLNGGHAFEINTAPGALCFRWPTCDGVRHPEVLVGRYVRIQDICDRDIDMVSIDK